MSGIAITVTGWVANDPYINKIDATTRFVSFRVGSTPRYFDRNKNEWMDGKTEWFTVKAWRDAADSIADSIGKSHPVIVQGRLSTNEWEDKEGVTRKDLVIDASTVGHDLSKGRAHFTRIRRQSEEGADDGQANVSETPASTEQAPDVDTSYNPFETADEDASLLSA